LNLRLIVGRLYDKRKIEKSAKIFCRRRKIFINLVAAEAYGGTIFTAMLGRRAKHSFYH
jgi:hypothetical protein